jgi:hypothetical protein
MVVYVIVVLLVALVFAALSVRILKQYERAVQFRLGRVKGGAKVIEVFGSNTFDVNAMKEKLPKPVFKSLQETIRRGTRLDPAIANEVAHAIKIPVATGENAYSRYEFRELIERRAARYLMPDVCRANGFSETLRIGHLAAAHGLPLSPHVVHEISLQVVGALSNGFLVELMDWAPADLFAETPRCEGGVFRIPDRPGHGMALAPGAIDKYRLR